MTNNTNTILVLAHFCEIHGPQTILSTRILVQQFSSSSSSPSSPPVVGSSETGTSCANCSYNVPDTTTTPVLRTQRGNHTLISSRTTTDPLLREACVRALSVETLPKGQLSGSFTTNTDIKLLGNEETRTFNIAHVFRLSDPLARGQKRVYAFIAVGDSGLVRWQGCIIRAFETWGRSVGELSQRQLRAFRRQNDGGGSGGEARGRGSEGEMSLSSSVDLTSATPSPPLSLETPLEGSPPRFMGRSRFGGSGSAAGMASTGAGSSAQQKNVMPVSSFLSAKTVDPDGYPRSANGLAGWTGLSKTRSMADVVGDEFFFVRLHAEFCTLMEQVVGTEEVGDDVDGGGNKDRLSANRGGRLGSGSDEEACMESDEDDDEGDTTFGVDSEDLVGKWRIDE